MTAHFNKPFVHGVVKIKMTAIDVPHPDGRDFCSVLIDFGDNCTITAFLFEPHMKYANALVQRVGDFNANWALNNGDIPVSGQPIAANTDAFNAE